MNQPTTAVSKRSLDSIQIMLSQAWNSYKSDALTYSGIILIPLIISAIATLIMAAMGVIGTGALLGSSLAGSRTAFAGSVFVLGLITVVFLVVLLYVNMWGQGALLYKATHDREKISIGQAYQNGRRLIAPLFITGIIAGVLIFIGFLLLIIPGIYLSVMYCLVLPIVVVEGLRGSAALRQSQSYVKDYWLDVFVRLAVLALAFWLVSWILGLFGKTPGQVLIFIFELAAIPFGTLYIYRLYSNLKAVKQGAAK